MQNKFKDKYSISSARLQSWDYSKKGAYFITICTQNREHFFGKIIKHSNLFECFIIRHLSRLYFTIISSININASPPKPWCHSGSLPKFLAIIFTYLAFCGLAKLIP